MTQKAKDKLTSTLTATFFVVGCCFAFLAYDRFEEQESRKEAQEEARLAIYETMEARSAVDLEQLLVTGDFEYNEPTTSAQDAELLMVFLVSPKVCPPCISEIAEFRAVADSLSQADGKDVFPVTLIVDEDQKVIDRFLKIAPLSGLVGSGYDSDLVASLGGYGDHETLLQQVKFIHTKKSEVIYQVILPSRATSSVYKAGVLNAVFEGLNL